MKDVLCFLSLDVFRNCLGFRYIKIYRNVRHLVCDGGIQRMHLNCVCVQSCKYHFSRSFGRDVGRDAWRDVGWSFGRGGEVSTSSFRRRRRPAALLHHLGVGAAAPGMVVVPLSFGGGRPRWDRVWWILGSHTDFWR
jgi:hypothetical protein